MKRRTMNQIPSIKNFRLICTVYVYLLLVCGFYRFVCIFSVSIKGRLQFSSVQQLISSDFTSSSFEPLPYILIASAQTRARFKRVLGITGVGLQVGNEQKDQLQAILAAGIVLQVNVHVVPLSQLGLHHRRLL